MQNGREIIHIVEAVALQAINERHHGAFYYTYWHLCHAPVPTPYTIQKTPPVFDWQWLVSRLPPKAIDLVEKYYLLIMFTYGNRQHLTYLILLAKKSCNIYDLDCRRLGPEAHRSIGDASGKSGSQKKKCCRWQLYWDYETQGSLVLCRYLKRNNAWM